ncbi:hypothetical protein GCM10010530_54410 [Kribbella aluminosa]
MVVKGTAASLAADACEARGTARVTNQPRASAEDSESVPTSDLHPESRAHRFTHRNEREDSSHSNQRWVLSNGELAGQRQLSATDANQ